MKLLLILFSVSIALLMIYLTLLNYKKKILNLLENIIWIIVWLSFLFLSFRPKLLDDFIRLNFGLTFFYIFTVLGIICIVVVLFFFYNKIKILESKQDALIRSESLRKIFNKIKDE